MQQLIRSGVPTIIVLCLFLSRPAGAQTIPAIGTEATLDVATWNVEWFGNPSNGPSDDERQRANVRAVIEQSQIDLWALQEIDDPADFNLLLQELGDAYGGIVRDNTSGAVTQRLAFVYRKDVITVTRTEQLFLGQSQYEDAFGFRPPLKIDARVTLPDTTVSVSFITLHMKAGGTRDDYDRREAAARALKNRLDQLHANQPIIILGDLNDELGSSITSGRDTPYRLFLDDTARYRFLTLSLGETPTWCGGSISCSTGSTLDHIFITDELFDAYSDGFTGRYDALLDAFDGLGGACNGEFVCTTSDHLPVYARFAFATNTAAEQDAGPNGFVLELPFPNPFRNETTLGFTLDQAGPVRLDVYDVLGRRVAVLSDEVRRPGRHTVPFNAAGLPAGVYLVVLKAGARIVAHPLIKAE